MNYLVMNPGGNSLKVEVVECAPSQRFAFEGKNLVSLILEGIGKEPCLQVLEGSHPVHSEPVAARDFAEAAASVISWLEKEQHIRREGLACIGVRVVHGGSRFTEATRVTPEVEKEIRDFERLAPLHNKSSVELLAPIRSKFPELPIYAVFDTAFHRTIPEYAALYPLPAEVSQKHGIRRFGFHGTSHRYILERAAHILGKSAAEVKLVTLHLESGCSACAIDKGRSVDNTMGFTPLEGLMMGTRSGDVDPSLVEFLMREAGMQADEVMTLLNKQSGLLGVSQKSLDTRVLMKSYGQDPGVTLAIDMFAYRIVKAFGAYLSALGGADAVVFGGGIGENNQVVRQRVGDALHWCGLKLDASQNAELIDKEGILSTPDATLKALVVVTQEGLQIAHECNQALQAAG